ncbi:MAG: LPS export ABC transporter permease LptF [Methylococcales bacterium]|nr:LPS export ABC transporter permease LptF [Methylococcales bacterium]
MIIKDLTKTLLAVLSVIVVIIVSRKFIKVLAKAIEGNISNETVLSILGLNTVVAIGAFLPAAIFMEILMVLGRMYRDHEMVAVSSAGGGVGVIYRAVFLMVFPLGILASGLSMVATPWAEASMRELMHEDKKVADIRGIAAGRFSEYSQGDLVFYTEDIDADKRMHNVFVQNREGNKLGIVSAKYGWIKYLQGGLYLVLEKGERIQGVPGEKMFGIEKFDEYAIRIEKKTKILHQKRDAMASSELWSSEKVEDIAEIQQRLSVPLAVIFLSFLAVPLAKLSPRGGVYGSLIIAFGIYFVYGNLRRISHSWVVNETIPVSLGYFWLYLLLLLLGVILLVRLYGIEWIIMKIKQRGMK